MALTVDLITKLIKPVPNGSNSGSNYQIDKPVPIITGDCLITE